MDWQSLNRNVQNEGTELGNAIAGYNKVTNLGDQKKAMLEFSKEVGMPPGYENKVAMAKDPDALAMVAGEILSYQRQKNVLSVGNTSFGEAGKIAEEERNRLTSTLTPEQLNDPYKKLEIDQAIDQKRTSALTSGLMSGLKTVGEVKEAQSLFGSGSASSYSDQRNQLLKDQYALMKKEDIARKAINTDNSVKKQVADRLAQDLKNMNITQDLKDIKMIYPSMNSLSSDIEGLNNSGLIGELEGNRVFGLLRLPDNSISDKLRTMGITDKDKNSQVSNKVIAMRTSLKDFINQYIRSMSGLTVSNTEREDYNQMFGQAMWSDPRATLTAINKFIDKQIDKSNNMDYRAIYKKGGQEPFFMTNTDRTTYSTIDAYNELYAPIIDRTKKQLMDIKKMLPSVDETYKEVKTPPPPHKDNKKSGKGKFSEFND